MSIISLKEVSKLYHTKEVETIALENVNLSIEQGEFVSIMGPSGCGKSTLLNIIGLLDKASSGSLELLGRYADRVYLPGPQDAAAARAAWSCWAAT